MSGSSDSESDVEVRAEDPVVVVRKGSFVPLVGVLCVLCYVYGLWLGMYLCPK
jgi:hypothetical protein